MKRNKSNIKNKKIIGCGNFKCETCKHMFGTDACETEKGIIIEEGLLNEFDEIMKKHFQEDEIYAKL